MERKYIVKYCREHDTFAPSFNLIFIGRRAVVSIKHHREEKIVGHIDTDYGLFFWLRLILNIRKCFKEQINHKQLT